MATKRCSIRGHDYEEGSFSDIIHQYIEASSVQDLANVKQSMVSERRLQELRYWSDGALSEFIPHFKERFKNIAVGSSDWNLEIDKWNWMGTLLGQLEAYKWSEEIYRALYDLLIDLQATRGRISKGTPLHQIGWVDLLRGTPDSLKRSQYHMKLAMIEDKLSADAQFKALPAYRVLTGEHNLPGVHLDRLAHWVDTYRTKHTGPCLRPELVYLDYVINRDNHERSSLYHLDSKLAIELMESVEKATTPNTKGESLEILMAYLFLTSPGFEVVRDLVSFDGQIDLLIRNCNVSDPVLAELGKYIVVECRNLKERVDAPAIREFAAKVTQMSCNSGILISKRGVTGDTVKEAARDARMAILKVHQRHGIVIVPLAIPRLKPIIEKDASLLEVLVTEYERMRFDLP